MASPLEPWLERIAEWSGQGISPEVISALLEDEGILTSPRSVRRAIHRSDFYDEPLVDHTHAVREKPIAAKQVEWGFGAAKPVVALGNEDELVVFGSDFHFPYHDDGAIDAFIALVEDVQPDRVVLNGDIADFFQLSRFNTALSRLDDLQEEIDLANDFRGRVRDAAPNAMLCETEGNHDNRIRSFVLHNARALSSLRALEPGNLFGYNDYEITWFPGCGFLLRPEFLVKHGTVVRQEAGASAKAELMTAGISGISGHVHRLCTYRRIGYTQRQWTEQGGFFRLDPDYIVGQPNWSQGCVVGEFSNTSPSFTIHEVPYVDGELRLGLKRY